jgi:hypothetical protein
MTVTSPLNTTSQNRTKLPRLNAEHVIPIHSVRNKAAIQRFLNELITFDAQKATVLYNIGKRLLGSTENPAALRFLEDYAEPALTLPHFPSQEPDLLGTVYQFLNTKLENLEQGSFYTGPDLADDLVGDLSFRDGQTILDPACGSGVLLFASDAAPDQLIGVDNDPIAIMIAKFNYFLKFPDGPSPRLYHDDFFAWHTANKGERFTYVVGNPPYGANLDLSNLSSQHVTSGESFSYFIELGYELLAKDGLLRFLVPAALLNVKLHTDIREFILGHTNLVLVKSYKAAFAGVMSDIYRIDLDRQDTDHVTFIVDDESIIPKALFKTLKNKVFSNLSTMDVEIIEKVRSRCSDDLSGATFGLGVVTGNNKDKLLAQMVEGAERIYSGKEVEKYVLKPALNYLIFDRSNLQQVAPDHIYRASEKLVYKTISTRLKVAIDRTGSLTTNSANIIIPEVPKNNIASVAALLNSDLYSYLNISLFGGVNKISRENLEHLPMPYFSEEQLVEITELVENFDGDDSELQDYIHRVVFCLTDDELRHIHNAT